MHNELMNTNTRNTKKTLVTCPKCLGVGNFPTFAHIVGGTCFRCGGAGKCEERIENARVCKPAPRFIPNASTPYAVVITDERAIEQGSGGRIGGNMSWEEAVRLCASLTREHGISYEIIKSDRNGIWSNRAGVVLDV